MLDIINKAKRVNSLNENVSTLKKIISGYD